MMKSAVLLLFLAFLSACATTTDPATAGRQTTTGSERTKPGNALDIRKLSAEMVKEALGGEWLIEFTRANRRQPVISVDEIRNQTVDRDPEKLLSANMVRELMKSDRVQYLDAGGGNIKPRADADFAFLAVITSVRDAAERGMADYYQFDLTLSSRQDKHVVWQGQRRIRKNAN